MLTDVVDYDKEIEMISENVKLSVQINGKFIGHIGISKTNLDIEDIKKAIKESELKTQGKPIREVIQNESIGKIILKLEKGFVNFMLNGK